MIKVSNTIKIREHSIDDDFNLVINSHWNDNKMVVLVIPGGESFTICAKDLLMAISNATNSARF